MSCCFCCLISDSEQTFESHGLAMSLGFAELPCNVTMFDRVDMYICTYMKTKTRQNVQKRNPRIYAHIKCQPLHWHCTLRLYTHFIVIHVHSFRKKSYLLLSIFSIGFTIHADSFTLFEAYSRGKLLTIVIQHKFMIKKEI